MAFVYSPELPYLISLPMTASDEIHRRVDAAMSAARMWAFVGDHGTRILVNPAALRVLGIVEDETTLPAWARNRPILSTTPEWDVPDTFGELVGEPGDPAEPGPT